MSLQVDATNDEDILQQISNHLEEYHTEIRIVKNEDDAGWTITFD